MPKRIQRKRTKGFKLPDECVYVGRPTKWGNPFTGNLAVEKYELAISKFPVPHEYIYAWKKVGGDLRILMVLAGKIHEAMGELKGKDLACWCPLDKPCHADILLEIVNEADIV